MSKRYSPFEHGDADPPRVCQAERSAPRRKTAQGRSAPLVWLVTGGSLVWMFVIFVIALYAIAREERSQPRRETKAVQVPAQVMIAAPNVVEVVEVPEVAEPFPMPAPVAPKLPFREAPIAKIDDMPPPLRFLPEEAARDQRGPVDDVLPAVKKREFDFGDFANCAQIGTNVMFMRDPPDAFRRAKQEKKLVFMVHLSGNLEDKDFT